MPGTFLRSSNLNRMDKIKAAAAGFYVHDVYQRNARTWKVLSELSLMNYIRKAGCRGGQGLCSAYTIGSSQILESIL